MRRETNGIKKKSFKLRKEQFYNNLATVLQEIEIIRRETNGRKK